MRYCLYIIVLSVGPAFAATSPARPQVELDDFTELLKLHKDQLPPITSARPLIRLSPAGKQFIYIRRYGSKAKLHLRRAGSADSDGPVVWDEPIPALYCRMSFAGLAWRADSRRVLFAQELMKDKPGWAPNVYGRCMRPWHMCYDLPMPQFKSCRHARIKGTTGCTALSYSPDGKLLWTAFSEPKGYKLCGITCWNAATKRSRTVYKKANASIYHLVPSPDGKHLAWVETHPRKPKGTHRGTEVIVLDIKARKVVHRIGLTKHAGNWVDTRPPVWSRDSTAICYGDVVEMDRVFRREVRLLPLRGSGARVLVRDALAVGATDGGIICNRGPGCEPMRQSISSWRPPGGGAGLPRTNDVILCSPSAKGPSTTLVRNAFAQQVLPGSVVYTQVSGDDVIIIRARLKRRGKPDAAPRRDER